MITLSEMEADCVEEILSRFIKQMESRIGKGNTVEMVGGKNDGRFLADYHHYRTARKLYIRISQEKRNGVKNNQKQG